jgi:ATP-binding cassette, subfamily B, bacterial CvaB/MchF/RaxB
MLFLDEGTTHLDVDNEKCINERLRCLNMTRISVAHRPEITSGAHRILRVGGHSQAVQRLPERALS